ncbi:hypothetical protein GCM10009107_48550 [Ideonella azotifigens]|uniref:ESPR domain-containing protein n=1 Tax=Ideonella azotifigens TaxID=513160 RepID=A0ABN1KDK7_9BURK
MAAAIAAQAAAGPPPTTLPIAIDTPTSRPARNKAAVSPPSKAIGRVANSCHSLRTTRQGCQSRAGAGVPVLRARALTSSGAAESAALRAASAVEKGADIGSWSRSWSETPTGPAPAMA